MDNLPKGENQQDGATQGSGDIFSNTAESPYEQATHLPLQTEQVNQQETDTSQQDAFPPQLPNLAEEENASSTETIQPPPFVENGRRKYFFIFGVILFVLILLVGVFVLLKRSTKKPAVSPPITLDYWGLWEDEAIMRSIFNDYQRQHTNITVKYTRQDQKQYRERLQATIDRGEGPDVFRFHNTWFPMMVKYLTPVPKTIYTDDYFTKNFYPVVTSDLKNGGNYYGIPLQIDGLLLFYNEDILKGANVSVPSTWVDVQNAVPKLTVKEKDRIVTSAIALGAAENVEYFSDILSLMMLQNGTQMVKSVFTCADSSNTTCAVEALSFYHKFAETPNNTWDDTLENSILAFAGGKVAMIFAPSWEVFTVKTIKPELNFKTAPVPQLPCDRQPCPSVNLASYWVEGVSAKSKNADAAFDLVKYMSQPEVLQKLYAQQMTVRKYFGEAYPLVEQGKLLADNQYLAPLIAQAPTMKSFYAASRTYDGDTGLNASLITYLKDAVNSLSQGVSPETALKTVDSGFKQVFTRFGMNTAP